MFTFDNTTLIVAAVLLLLAVITSLLNPFFRKVKVAVMPNDDPQEENATLQGENTEVQQEGEQPLPPLSLVFTPHDNAQELERNLPLYLDQDYPSAVQIIVVAPQNDHETGDVLKRFADNKRLYTTFIPDSSRYMSRKKLAITLGVKAAEHEWVLMGDICSYPLDNNWLKHIARHCVPSRDLVVGYTRYHEDMPSYRLFESYQQARYAMAEYQHGRAYDCPFRTLLFRKSLFLEKEGFRGNLKFLRGEYDFVVNKYATRNNLALDNSQQATLIEEVPTEKVWMAKHLFYLENRKYLERSFRHKCIVRTDQVALHTNYIVQIVVGVGAASLQFWTIALAALISLIVTLILRMIIGKRALNKFDVGVPAWKIIPFEIAVGWHKWAYRIKHHRANKYDFISHKL